MRLEDIKQEFPQTPDDIYQMIQNKVEEQLHAEQMIPYERKVSKMRLSFPKAVAVCFAAVMLMGTTVFAGVKLYQIYTQKNGTYGVQTIMEHNDTKDNSISIDKVPEIEIMPGYLPEGMFLTGETGDIDKLRIEYEDSTLEGGISMHTVLLDVEQEKVSANHTYVVFSEMISFHGHDGVYMERKFSEDAEAACYKTIYLIYPEVHRVLIMDIGKNVTKEEALKVAEHIELVATGQELEAEKLYTWSAYAEGNIEENGEEEYVAFDKAGSSQMKNLHTIGGSAVVPSYCYNAAGEDIISENVEVKLEAVDISDNLSLLTKEYIPEEWRNVVDSNGKLVKNEFTYYKRGDGINSLDEKVKTETVEQKLVYVTLEYKNTSDETLNDILFFGTLKTIRKDADTYEIIDYNAPSDAEFDYRKESSVARIGDMSYYDIHSEDNKNYISSLNAGESCTVHMAWIVNETELDELYLDLNTSGGYTFNEESLEIGLFDIHQ